MIYLFTDFGYSGPYVGEIHAVFKRQLADVSLIDLMHDAPTFNAKASSYLLAALSRRFQPGDSCLAVVDPDVGMMKRRALLVEADGVIYSGPDNGLLSQIIRLASEVSCYEILWRPADLSDSFHGRDLFAPAITRYMTDAEQLALQKITRTEIEGIDWGMDDYSIIYFDQFGNAITGIRGSTVQRDNVLSVNNTKVKYARTFAAVQAGQPFWYVNSMGLVELAVNQGSACEILTLNRDSTVTINRNNK